MKRQHLCLTFALTLGSLLFTTQRGFSQSITGADDGVGTTVLSDGNQFDISGGSLSGDGANLFHSFENFGLSTEQVANFMADPALQNILGRVIGGDPSIVDGTVQVSGGSANLYLMNPAGIIFGNTAQINVPADFVATTADSIGFGDDVFEAIGDADYSGLMGSPTSLNFDTATVGTVMNSGELAVNDGQTLTLAGDRIINIGTVDAPGGTVTLAAVPERGQLIISQAGAVMSLGVDADAWQSNAGIDSFAPLITGGELPLATQVTVDANGQVTLAGANSAGTAVVSGTVSAASSNGAGGTVQVVGPQVALIDATVDVSGATGGGTALIGGEYRGQGSMPTATNTLVDTGSKVSASAINSGNGGEVIIWADGTTAFDGEINAGGGNNNGDGGFVEVSGANRLIFTGDVDTTAVNGTVGELLLDPTDITITAGNTSTGFTGQVLAGDAGPSTISQVEISALPGSTDVVIQASNNITIEPLGTLVFQPGAGTISFEAGGSFSMSPNDTIDANARNISITASDITAGFIDSSFGTGLLSTSGSGGDVNLTATNGNISLNGIGTIAGITGNGGAIIVNATNGSFSASTVETVALTGQGGEINITATNGISIERLLDAKPNGQITLNGNVLNGSTFSLSRGTAPLVIDGGGSIAITDPITGAPASGPLTDTSTVNEAMNSIVQSFGGNNTILGRIVGEAAGLARNPGLQALALNEIAQNESSIEWRQRQSARLTDQAIRDAEMERWRAELLLNSN
ncbi:filamentous hemagglutinin N-terminal domain-containing protein [Leptothoe sp. ISB3NOV94-8A]